MFYKTYILIVIWVSKFKPKEWLMFFAVHLKVLPNNGSRFPTWDLNF